MENKPRIVLHLLADRHITGWKEQRDTPHTAKERPKIGRECMGETLSMSVCALVTKKVIQFLCSCRYCLTCVRVFFKRSQPCKTIKYLLYTTRLQQQHTYRQATVPHRPWATHKSRVRIERPRWLRGHDVLLPRARGRGLDSRYIHAALRHAVQK